MEATHAAKASVIKERRKRLVACKRSQNLESRRSERVAAAAAAAKIHDQSDHVDPAHGSNAGGSMLQTQVAPHWLADKHNFKKCNCVSDHLSVSQEA